MRGRRERRVATEAQLVLAWYTRAGWQRLCELVPDRAGLDDTFDDWERSALAAIGELAGAGRQVRKVPIDVEALAVWCHAHGRPLDHAARAEYVSYLLQSAPAD